jgi:hypothetical protein
VNFVSSSARDKVEVVKNASLWGKISLVVFLGPSDELPEKYFRKCLCLISPVPYSDVNVMEKLLQGNRSVFPQSWCLMRPGLPLFTCKQRMAGSSAEHSGEFYTSSGFSLIFSLFP